MPRIAPSFLAVIGLTLLAAAGEPYELEVDFSARLSDARPLHGINKGPLAPNGLIDVTAEQRALKPPFNRLHDCHHPNPDVVDVHAVFPNPAADPADPASYDFRATDLYLAAVQATGARMVYRLGESIEHQAVKRYVHPPADPARWAEVCAGIVRHNNEGWAGGPRLAIPYWEIWNEPENRPVMWTGTDDQFLELYAVTARRLRCEFPAIKIGGPGFGYCGRLEAGTLHPSPLCAAFLERCRREALPLDFFSWHTYTDDPEELATRARAVRRLLDEHGFTRTESHLNEWNFLPDNSWEVLSREALPAARQRAVDRMVGAEGGAFLVAGLLAMQDAPIDVANFYHGETGLFGLFTEVGAPNRNYHAMLAFARWLETPRRVRVSGGDAHRLAVAAGVSLDESSMALLVANRSGPARFRINWRSLPWRDGFRIESRLVDAEHAFGPAEVAALSGDAVMVTLRPPAVALITVRPIVDPASSR